MAMLRNYPSRFFLFISLLVLLGITARISWTMLASSDWPMFRGDIFHKGQSLNPGPQPVPDILWSTPLDGPIISSPAIGSDGTIFVGTVNGSFYAVNPDGSIKCSIIPDGLDIWSSSAVDDTGSIYVGTLGGALYKISSGCAVLWSYPTPGPVFSSPVIAPNGNIIVGSGEPGGLIGGVHSVTPAGVSNWDVVLPGALIASPAIDAYARVVITYNDVGTGNTVFDALDPSTGASDIAPVILGPTLAGGLLSSSPLAAFDTDPGRRSWVGANGILYSVAYDLGSAQSSLTFAGLNPDATSPAMGPSGTIYIAESGGDLYSFPPGSSVPTAAPGSVAFASPVVGFDETVYLPTGAGLEAFAGPTLTPLWQLPIPSSFSSPAIGANGVLYVGSDDGSLYAVGNYVSVFNADFNTDTAGGPPSTSPPGPPDFDSVALLNEAAASGDFIQVASGLADFTSNAVHIHRNGAAGNSPAYRAQSDTGLADGTSGVYTISWEWAPLQAGSASGFAWLRVAGTKVFNINFNGLGYLTVLDGGGNHNTGINYTANVSMAFVAIVDIDAGTYDLYIDGALVLDNSPFDGGLITDIGIRLGIEIGGMATEDYAFDNVRMVAGAITVAGPDTDNDGIPDAGDNCPNDFNISQSDIDSDGTGDACDPNTALHATFDQAALGTYPSSTYVYPPGPPANDRIWVGLSGTAVANIVAETGLDRAIAFDNLDGDNHLSSIHAGADTSVGASSSGTLIYQWTATTDANSEGETGVYTPLGRATDITLIDHGTGTGNVYYSGNGLGLNATGVTYVPGQYVIARVVVDMQAQSFDLFINGAPIVSGVPFVQPGSPAPRYGCSRS